MWETVLGWLTKLLFGWWTQRRQAQQLADAIVRGDKAEAREAQDTQIIHAQETRHAVDEEVEQMPASATGKVADDPAGSAGRELHDHWERD